jgi:hypothetical protein
MAATAVSFLMIGSLGCKGKTTVKDNPETVDKLTTCETKLKDKIEYINTLNEQITKLESGGASADGAPTVVVQIDGDIMNIVAGKGKGPNGHGDSKGNAKDAELYEAFVASVKRSRGAIKKCYQSALKKNSALASRSITLNIGVNYSTSGNVKNARFSPRVSEQFNMCMDGVAKKWKLPAMPQAVAFNYKQTLTPE